MSNPHDKFFKAREIERITWRDYVAVFAVGLIFFLMVAFSI